MLHKIIIVPDHLFSKKSNFRNWPTQIIHLKLNSKKYKNTVVIAPAAFEHYSLFNLFKFKIYCEKISTKIIGFGPLNQFPLLSLVSHEVAMVENKLSFYDGDFTEVGAGTKSIQNDPNFCNTLPKSPKCLPIFKDAQKLISNDEVVERFSEINIMIMQSSYELFKKNNLPKNQISCQISCTCGPGPIGLKVTEIIKNNQNKFIYPFFNIDYTECKKYLTKVNHHFLAHQILASLLLDWYFIAVGGAGTLLSLVPVKSLLTLDRNFNNVTSLSDEDKITHEKIGIDNQEIMRKIAIKRYGKNIGETIPILDFDLFDIDQINHCISQNKLEIQISDFLIDTTHSSMNVPIFS